jgi:hypothetical protein
MIVHAQIALYHCKKDLRFVNCQELNDKCQSVELFVAVNFAKYALINIHTTRKMHTKVSVNTKERYYCGRFRDRWKDNIKWV